MASAPKRRFGTLSVEEIAVEREGLQNQNTVKNENKAANAFKSYLSEIGVEDTNFFTYN